MLKNLFITNEGSKCSNCNSLILVKQSYKETLKYPFGLLLLIMFFTGSIVLLEPFGEFTKGSFIEGTLFEVFLNMIVLFTPMIILTLVYCYKIPIVEGTDEEITKRNKIGIASRLIMASIFFNELPRCKQRSIISTNSLQIKFELTCMHLVVLFSLILNIITNHFFTAILSNCVSVKPTCPQISSPKNLFDLFVSGKNLSGRNTFDDLYYS